MLTIYAGAAAAEDVSPYLWVEAESDAEGLFSSFSSLF